MKQINSKNLKKIRKDIESVLKIAADQLGISLTLGTFRYSFCNFTVKIIGICESSDGQILNPQEKAYLDMQSNNKQSKNILNLNDTFIFRNETYIICGWRPWANKYPLIVKNKKGAYYKFSASYAYKKDFSVYEKNQKILY